MNKGHVCRRQTRYIADTDLLKMVNVEILFNFENYFRTLQLGF